MNSAEHNQCLSWKENESWSEKLVWCHVVDSEIAASELITKGLVFSKAMNCLINREGYNEPQNQL